MFLCALGVLLCQKLSQCVGKSPFPFPEGQVSFHLPAAGRLSTHIYLGPGMCVYMWFFVVFFESTMLWRLTANPKFGIPDMVMRKQTFLHLK